MQPCLYSSRLHGARCLSSRSVRLLADASGLLPKDSSVQVFNRGLELLPNIRWSTGQEMRASHTRSHVSRASYKESLETPLANLQNEDATKATRVIRRVPVALVPSSAATGLIRRVPLGLPLNSTAYNAANRGQYRADYKILEEWLDLPNDVEKSCYWLKIRGKLNSSTLVWSLLCYLQRDRPEVAPSSSLETSLPEKTRSYLNSQGFNEMDLREWASILSCVDPDKKVELFLSTGSARPIFLFLEVLRGKILQVRTLKLLLMYTRDHVLADVVCRKSSWHGDSSTAQEREKTETALSRSGDAYCDVHVKYQDLFVRLFDQARRIWPQAMVPVAEMMADFIRSVASANSRHPELDRHTHTRLCRLYNFFLGRAASAAYSEPYLSAIHNWHAQTTLLKLGSQFRPALITDHNSYRAIVSVLAASKKSARESKAAKLRARSWPPWRIEQHGIDARRSREEDLSRVTLALSRTMESGYHLSTKEVAAQILGGQDLDGTPTIHTRTIHNLNKDVTTYVPKILIPEVWAARIRATRDVEEGWNAFLSFIEAGGKPDQSMYAAMLEKFVFEGVRHSNRGSARTGASGDGKELLPPAHDGFSEFYRSKLRPPPFDVLYTEMLSIGILLPERSVALLVAKAATLDDGIQYLMDAGINHEAVDSLSGHGETATFELLTEIPEHAFSAFITLLCRFCPRLGSRKCNKPFEQRRCQESSDNESSSKEPVETQQTVVSTSEELTIIELGQNSSTSSRFPNPLLLATQLVMKRRSVFRPTWFALFHVLAREGCVIDRWVSRTRNDLLAWRVLEAVLGDFHKLGLELDPKGFQTICWGLRKVLRASLDSNSVSEDEVFGTHARTGLKLLKTEFRKLTEVNTEVGIPTLLHSIRGVHLHAYIRAIGAINDYEEILYVLRWMVEHHDILNEIGDQAANGHTSLRRTLICIKSALVDDMVISTEAEKLVESVDSWDGWPTDEEVDEYLQKGRNSG